MKDLVLYYYEECPYCQRVLRYLEEKNIKLKMKNTRRDNAAREELLRLGGKTQVPCLMIDGEPLYESLDIIDWLEKNIVYVPRALR
ncbi:MAG: glutathione S-transferase N-terminal domain-containing protein [Leptospiraceae bacterium]|nr:glutathione S-transferase N-terminal domain-containing protein [Leptospiraceae bacterium]